MFLSNFSLIRGNSIYPVLFVLLFASLLFSSSLALESSQMKENQEVKILNLYLEIAEKPEEKKNGLMYRKSLCNNCGMLFIFKPATKVGFWMKNTYISLDMIFIDENWIITDIHRNTQPLREDIYYSPSKEINYVLEVNAQYAKNHHLEVGQKLVLHNYQSSNPNNSQGLQ